MSATVLYMSMSLDGFIAGPNESPENGLGDGGERLHDWLWSGNEPGGPSGVPGRPSGVNGQIYDEFMSTGAVVAGRGTFEPAGGWGGDHHDGVPIFVVARHEPGIDISRWPLVSYVDDVTAAMTRAKEAAGDKNVLVHGAGVTRLALAAGVLEELELHVVPVLFGQGRLLFEGLHAEQSESLITLGVSDYEKANAFYAAPGWQPVLEIEETAFFQANGVVLVLWAREKLAADSGIADDGAHWGGITLAHNVASAEEVEGVIERAREAGGTITREPSETFYGGYAGVFRDLDGKAWEIAHNPGFGLAADGSVILRAEVP